MQISDKNRDKRSIALLALICAVLQLALAPNVGLGNGRANIALVFAVTVALTVGGPRATIAGFAAGLFFDLASTGPVGLMALLLSVVSYVLGSEGRNRMAGDFGAALLQFLAADLAVCVLHAVGMMLAGQGSGIVDALFLRALPTAALTLVAFLPFAYFESRVRTSGPNLGGGHFKRGL